MIPAHVHALNNVLYWPVPGYHTYGSSGFHGGNARDIVNCNGATIVAAMGGTVTRKYECTEHHDDDSHYCLGFGTGIVIAGDDGRTYQYAHMQAGSIPSNIQINSRVEAGQMLGRVGNTGWSYGAHLHFGISNTSNHWEPGPDPANESYYDPAINNAPIGIVECEIVNNNQLHIHGWAFDPDEPSKSIAIHVYVNDVCCTGIAAANDSPDVNRVYGITGNHRFDTYIDLYVYGTVKINYYGIDSQGGGPSVLGEITNTPKDYYVTSTRPSLSYASINTIPDQVYTGQPIEPDIVVNYGYRSLTNGEHYSVSYSGNTATGVATVTITGIGQYVGSKVITFNIVDGTIPETINMYRLYNPNSGEHFYTSSIEERNVLIDAGWNYEGVGWIAPSTSSTPVYRLYNQFGGEHHYTTDLTERNYLISIGWNDEGIGWYSDDDQSIPLYRQYNPNQYANNHNYTVSQEENDWLVSLGWQAEGIGWYAIGSIN